MPTVLFVESCSNPNGHLFNFDQLAALKKKVPRLTVCVDNTWLTSALLNPFQWPEVDYVVCSLTKYYGAGRSGIAGTRPTDELRADRVKKGGAFCSQLKQPQLGPANGLHFFNDELFLIIELTHQLKVHVRGAAGSNHHVTP